MKVIMLKSPYSRTKYFFKVNSPLPQWYWVYHVTAATVFGSEEEANYVIWEKDLADNLYVSVVDYIVANHEENLGANKCSDTTP